MLSPYRIAQVLKTVTLMDVLLNGIPSMPSGRRAGIGPYEPSSLFKNFLCVLGLPTCKVNEVID